MNVRRTVANVVVFTVDWVLIVGWIMTTMFLLAFAVFAAYAGANVIAGITLGTAVVTFIYFSLASGIWFILGMLLDYLKDIKIILNKENQNG